MEGVTLHKLKQIIVPKGDIFHILKSTDEGYVGFGEAYFSQIESGEVKGWKRHNHFTLNLVVPIGSVKFIIYDDRLDSETNGQFKEFVLSPNRNYSRLCIEPGLWVAFAGIGDGYSLLLDIIDEVHNPNEADKKELNEIPYNFNL